MTNADMSARDRHKQETLTRIHKTAEKLALEQGLINTRVEEIADIVGISRRTFFNYFPTKEDAVLGIQKPYVTDAAKRRFYESDEDLLTRTTYLVVDVVQTSSVAGSTREGRRALWKKFPELAQRFEARSTDGQNVLLPVLREYIEQSALDITEEETRLLLGLASTVFRSAYTLGPFIDEETIDQSLKMFKTTIRKVL